MAVSVLAVFAVMAVVLPATGVRSYGPADRVMVVGFGLLLAAGLWRFSMLRAVPSREGLRVVNLVHSRTLAWPEILRVGFSGGSPWAMLELADTEEVAVMAIQRADGPFGRAEAARLAALIEHHATAPER